MKKILFIFIFISTYCNSQKLKTTEPVTFYESGDFKITDYDLHYHISGGLQVVSTSFFYWKTENKNLSTGLGISTVIILNIVKQLLSKNGSSSNLNEGIKGAFYYGAITSLSISDIERRNLLLTDTTKYQNLNKK